MLRKAKVVKPYRTGLTAKLFVDAAIHVYLVKSVLIREVL